MKLPIFPPPPPNANLSRSSAMSKWTQGVVLLEQHLIWCQWRTSMFSSMSQWMIIICNHLEISIFHLSWLWCMYNADPAPYAPLNAQFQCPSFLCTALQVQSVQRNDGHWNCTCSGAYGAGSALYIHHSQLMWKILISKWLHMIIMHMELNIEVHNWPFSNRKLDFPCVGTGGHAAHFCQTRLPVFAEHVFGGCTLSAPIRKLELNFWISILHVQARNVSFFSQANFGIYTGGNAALFGSYFSSLPVFGQTYCWAARFWTPQVLRRWGQLDVANSLSHVPLRIASAFYLYTCSLFTKEIVKNEFAMSNSPTTTAAAAATTAHPPPPPRKQKRAGEKDWQHCSLLLCQQQRDRVTNQKHLQTYHIPLYQKSLIKLRIHPGQ